MQQFPPVPTSRLAVRITAPALRHIRRGHPWVWSDSIERVSDDGVAGQLAVVFDDDREFVGIGLFDPGAPIVIRMLHVGGPRQIDDAFFAEKITDAAARRDPLAQRSDTTAWRIVHGENDGLPGLVVDRYDSVLVVRLDTAAWVPHLGSVIEALAVLEEPSAIVLRASRRVADRLPPGLTPGCALLGDVPTAPVAFLEHGLVFEADVVKGHKTGHFLDQRDNRHLVAGRCHDATVLDVFCHTGGFTVHAAAAGARRISSVDISEHAIEATRRHIALNAPADSAAPPTEHDYIVGDGFEAMERLAAHGARFDVVIVDPPSFAPNQAAVPGARGAYRRLTQLALELLGSGGTLFQASCSSRIDEQEFHDLVADEIDQFGFVTEQTVRTRQPLDHPIGFEQGAYLKALLADVTPRSTRR